MNYRDYLQKIIYHVINPLIRGMIKMGITPNIVTAIGFLGNCIATGFFLYAALHVEETSARLGNMSSTFGALWDSTLDRYSELVTLFGIAIYFSQAGWFWMGVITFAAMVGSVMVSYVRARAEGLDIECKVGVMQRPERVVVTALGTIIAGFGGNLWWLASAMILIAILANLTAFWRIAHCYQVLKGRK